MEECILDWDASDGCLLREGLSPVLTVCSSSARLGSWPGVPFVGEGPVWRPSVLTRSGKREDTLCREQSAAYRRQAGRLACARTWGEACSIVRGWPLGVPPLIPVHALGKTGLLSTSVGAEREAPLSGSWPGGWPGQVHGARRAL